MYLLKRGPIYYLSFKNVEGKEIRVSTGCRTKVDATEYLRRFKLDEYLKKASRDQKVLSKYIAEFVRYSQCQHSPKTTASYRTALEEFRRTVGDRHLREIDIRVVEEFLLTKRDSRSLYTVRSYHTHLASAFEVAKRWGYLEDNPFRRIKRVRLPETTPAFLTKVQFQLLLSLSQDQDLKDVMVGAVTTGMRLGELMALRWEDVDLIHRTILVKSSEGFVTKNKKKRIIPINTALAATLHRRRTGNPVDKVFQGEGRRFNAEVVSKGFKNLVRLAGLDERLHFHSIRHTFASWLVQDGVSLYEVQKLLGHSSVVVTQVYSHLQPETLHGTVDRIKLNLN
jgi:integrase